jgi:hypothetical protein
MSMSGKTFLAAFQVGSRLVPDEIDRRISRKKINLEKDLLRIKKEVEGKKKEREKIGAESFNTFETGFNALNLNSTDFPSQYKNLVSSNVTGMIMSPVSKAKFEEIDKMVKENAIYKSFVDAENETAEAIQNWNKRNPLKRITDLNNTLPDILAAANDAYKEEKKEEEKEALRSKLKTEGAVKTELEDQAAFNLFVKETGSDFKPEDFNKPEAQNAMRIHNQIKEVEKLVAESGTAGIPILRKLAIKKDGTGYSNLVNVKAALQDVINQNKKSEKRSGKSLSQEEGNALSYSERMRFDNLIMDQADINGVNPSKELIDGFIADYGKDKAFSISNALLDEGFQSFKVAADNFIRAVLRKESGAAIAETEYIGAFKDYIPLLGDSPKVVQQKRTLRQGITNTMRRISGIPWDDSEFVNAPLQFKSEEQAERYYNLGYINPGDTIEIEKPNGFESFVYKPKPKKTP